MLIYFPQNEGKLIIRIAMKCFHTFLFEFCGGETKIVVSLSAIISSNRPIHYTRSEKRNELRQIIDYQSSTTTLNSPAPG